MTTRHDTLAKKTLPERIRLLADLAGSTAALASATGWALRSVQRYVSGDATPSRAKLIHLSVTSGCSLPWLEKGTGTTPTDNTKLMAAIRLAKGNMDEDWYPVSALPGEETRCPLHQVSRSWIESIYGPIDGSEPIACIKVKDASMAPMFLPGDQVLVAPISGANEHEITLWKDYAIQAYGQWYIRRRTPNGWDAITQGAVNFPLDTELVEVFGRAFAKVQVL